MKKQKRRNPAPPVVERRHRRSPVGAPAGAASRANAAEGRA
jgi:hypothetical protein